MPGDENIPPASHIVVKGEAGLTYQFYTYFT